MERSTVYWVYLGVGFDSKQTLDKNLLGIVYSLPLTSANLKKAEC